MKRIAKSTAKPKEDHRSRVGAERREKTRQRFLESAVTVFSEKGPDNAQIDDFIAAAGVARGTFYNYFRTTSELLTAVAGAMSDEVVTAVDPLMHLEPDPAARVATGMRLFAELARRYPLLGQFITRVGARAASRGTRLDRSIQRDVELGLSTGRLKGASWLVLRDLILGALFYGIETSMTQSTDESHIQQLVVACLKGAGLKEAEAIKIASCALPHVDPLPGSLISTLAPAKPRRTRRVASPGAAATPRPARKVALRRSASAG